MPPRDPSRAARCTIRASRIAVILLALLAPARIVLAAFDADEQACINSVARALADTTEVAGEVSSWCVAALARTAPGEPIRFGRGSTIEGCVASAPTVWRKRIADQARTDRVCARARADDPLSFDPQQQFGLFPGDVDTAARSGVAGLTDLVRDVFGPAPENVLRFSGATPQARTCQRATWGAARACALARQSELVRCLRDGLATRDPLRRIEDVHALRDVCLGTGASGQPDPHGWIARRCTSPTTGLAGVVGRRCAGQDLGALLPGCAGDSATAACLERTIACRTCLTVNRALGTTANCDRFDDGADDGSCGCGDGIRTPFEQCDDGNVVETDGCTSSCTEGPASCPCYTEAAIDRAFPPDFFASGRPACVEDELGAGFTRGTCLLEAPRDRPFEYPRLGAGVIDGICFFHPTPLSDQDGGWCRWPDFELVTGADIEGCRNVMRRSQAWQRECGR